jgi:hypothetical protein
LPCPASDLEGNVEHMPARPQNIHQARLLHLLREEGPRSRAELGDVIRLSRSKLAVELDRLTALGLVESGGLAASRGGRRSNIVRIAAHLRFVGIDIGATSVDVAVTNGWPTCPLRPTSAAARRPSSARRWNWWAGSAPMAWWTRSMVSPSACPDR